MSIEGRLEISLKVSNGLIANVDITSSRPMRVTSLFIGKAPEDVLRLIPTLYSICGAAQSCAAVSAAEQALAITPPAATVSSREIAVWAETAREHLLRLAMMLGRPTDGFAITDIIPLSQKMMAALGNVFALGAEVSPDPAIILSHVENLEAFLAASVFAEPLDRWRERQDSQTFNQWIEDSPSDIAQLVRTFVQSGWLHVGSGPEFHPLPSMNTVDLLGKISTESFVAQPTWEDTPCETTPLSRHASDPLIAALNHQNGTGLLTRMAALLTELAHIPVTMRHLIGGKDNLAANGLDTGVGLAQVEAARGRLAHALWVEDGLVANYRILAPTEWNFHPDGTAAQALGSLDATDTDTLKAQADMLISAIDPCVAYEVRII